jgi:hypothetical protein
LVGIAGEKYASQFLDPAAVAAFVANPVLPHPNNGRKYLETDLLVYAAGTLFCVEIKNYAALSHMLLASQGRSSSRRLGAMVRRFPQSSYPLRQAKGFVLNLIWRT